MSKLIEFPAQNQPAAGLPETTIPSYTGHILMLDRSKARKWQSFNFFVGMRCTAAVVPDDALMEQIHRAVLDGVLIDVTEHPELFQVEKPVAEVNEIDTGKKVYSGKRSFFRELGVADNDDRAPGDEIVSYASEDRDEQARIEAALAAEPVNSSPPVSFEEARRRARRPLLDLPPGMDNPELYLLPVPRS